MPTVSEAQRKAMYAAASGRSTLGIPAKVGKEFVGKDAAIKGAGICLYADDGAMLYIKRAKGDHVGTWGIPGGAIEKGETVEDAARRETREEVGYLAGDIKPVRSGDFAVFRADVNHKFKPRLNGEHSDFVWAKNEDAPKPLYPGMADVLAMDADKWITVHPNGKGSTGTAALIGEGGEVKGGMGGKFNGKNIKDAHGTKKFTSGETNAETEARHESEKSKKALSEGSRNDIARSSALYEKYGEKGEGSRGKFKSDAREGKFDHLHEELMKSEADAQQAKKEAQQAKNQAWKDKNLPKLAAAKKAREEAEVQRKRDLIEAYQKQKEALIKADQQKQEEQKKEHEKKDSEEYKYKTVMVNTGKTQRRRISADDPSIYGHELLGHEGEMYDFPIYERKRVPKTEAELAATPIHEPAKMETPVSQSPPKEHKLRDIPGKGKGVILTVPFADKDTAKAYGARWSPDLKKWYHPEGKEMPEGLKRWANDSQIEYAEDEILAMDAELENVLAFDRASVRSIDQDGRLHIAVTNISKACVNPYFGHEIPGAEALGLQPDKIYYMLRDPEELKKAAGTFNNIQLLQKHTPVSADDPKKYDTVGTTGSEAVFEHPYLKNSLAVWTEDAIKQVESGEKQELSCSYHYTPDMTPGTFEGVRYDGIMREIKGNHVALVAEGRAGKDVMVNDSTNEELQMAIKKQTYQKAAMAVKKLAKDEGVDIEELNELLDKLEKSEGQSEEKSVVNDAPPGVAEILDMLRGKIEDSLLAEVEEKLAAMETVKDEVPEQFQKKDEPEAKPEPKAEEQISKPTMDSAIASAVKSAEEKVVQRMRAIREAEDFVRPMVGTLKAFDSADAVYGAALNQLGVDTKDVHPSAFRAMLTMASAKKPQAKVASDSAISPEASKLFKYI